MRRLGGSPLIAVTFVTPGTARKRSCNWVKKADWRAPSGYVSAGTISITASATSATTSERIPHSCAPPAAGLDPMSGLRGE
ncbi:MAG: hypothetical protein IID06_02365 [Gemmatimonadetes bacterium]|nr:hypothetical protein [Gemmatimonadota bacterium]